MIAGATPHVQRWAARSDGQRDTDGVLAPALQHVVVTLTAVVVAGPAPVAMRMWPRLLLDARQLVLLSLV